MCQASEKGGLGTNYTPIRSRKNTHSPCSDSHLHQWSPSAVKPSPASLVALAILSGCALAWSQPAPKRWKGTPDPGNGNALQLRNPENWLDETEPEGDGTEDLLFGAVEHDAPQAIELDDFAVNNLTFASGRPGLSFKKLSDAAENARLAVLGNITVETGANVQFEEDLILELGTGDHAMDIADDTAVSLLGGIVDAASNSGSLVKRGGGVLRLGGNGNFAGGVHLELGALLLATSSNNSDGIRGPLGSGTLTLNEGTTLGPDQFLTNLTLHNPVVLTGQANVGNANADLSLKGGISGSGGLNVHGNLALEHPSSYAGPTSIREGILSLDVAGALPEDTELDLASDTKVVAKGGQTIKRLVGELASELEIAIGQTVTVKGAPGLVSHHSGTITGAGALSVLEGLTILDGESMLTGDTTIGSAAEFRIGHEGSPGSVHGAIQNSGILSFDRPDEGKFFAHDGFISGLGQVVNRRGITILNQPNDYAGDTRIDGGALIAGANNAFGTNGAIHVNPHAAVAVANASVKNSLHLSPGSTIAGIGHFGAATIGDGVTLAPGLNNGQPVGTLGFEELTLSGGGILDWNLANRHGQPGEGWDLITVTSPSTLTIDATADSRFTLELSTIGSGGQPEVIGDFEFGENYRWRVFDTAGIADFDPDAFAFDSTNFLTGLDITDNDFWLSREGDDLFLNFSPIPEPSTYALILTGLGMSGLGAWRRRRRATR